MAIDRMALPFQPVLLTLPALQTIARYMTRTPIVTLQNAVAKLFIEVFGGAISHFSITGNPVNPLTFALTPPQMPENNRYGAVYQGHFTCIGRWGEASDGEKKHGIPNHGGPANMLWQVMESNSQEVSMEALAAREGLEVKRFCQMDDKAPVFLLRESVTNLQAFGRPFNMVEHPTIAAPFLNDQTIIDCNGREGFHQAEYKNIYDNKLYWNEGKIRPLRNQQMNENAVYSFIVNKADEYGWVTAYSPNYNLLLGYVWKSKDYPWIHHWQHFNEAGIQYRGIEFGTAGIHQPFKEIIFTAPVLFDTPAMEWLDAGETTTKSCYGFLIPFKNISGIKTVSVNEEAIIVSPNEGEPVMIILSKKLANGLYK